jgi:hypothetical protein
MKTIKLAAMIAVAGGLALAQAPAAAQSANPCSATAQSANPCAANLRRKG